MCSWYWKWIGDSVGAYSFDMPLIDLPWFRIDTAEAARESPSPFTNTPLALEVQRPTSPSLGLAHLPHAGHKKQTRLRHVFCFLSLGSILGKYMQITYIMWVTCSQYNLLALCKGQPEVCGRWTSLCFLCFEDILGWWWDEHSTEKLRWMTWSTQVEESRRWDLFQ